MATSLSASLKAEINWYFQNPVSLSTTKDPSRIQTSISYSNGTGSNQINEMWHDRRTLSPATPTDDLDLRGILTNVFGETITLDFLKGIFIFNKGLEGGDGSFTPSAGENLVIGGGSNPISSIFNYHESGRLTIPAGGRFFIDAPLDGFETTGASSGDILRVSHDGTNDITYDIVLFGLD